MLLKGCLISFRRVLEAVVFSVPCSSRAQPALPASCCPFSPPVRSRAVPPRSELSPSGTCLLTPWLPGEPPHGKRCAATRHWRSKFGEMVFPFTGSFSMEWLQRVTGLLTFAGVVLADGDGILNEGLVLVLSEKKILVASSSEQILFSVMVCREFLTDFYTAKIQVKCWLSWFV